MDIAVYKLIHIFGILLLFLSLGGVAVYIINGGSKATNSFRRNLAIFHGVGLALILISGFGMLAKLGIGMPPLWAWLKIGIWLILGAAIAFAQRKAGWAKLVFWLAPILGLLAAFIAVYRTSLGL